MILILAPSCKISQPWEFSFLSVWGSKKDNGLMKHTHCPLTHQVTTFCKKKKNSTISWNHLEVNPSSGSLWNWPCYCWCFPHNQLTTPHLPCYYFPFPDPHFLPAAMSCFGLCCGAVSLILPGWNELHFHQNPKGPCQHSPRLNCF